MIVLDASVALSWIYKREKSEENQIAKCVLEKIETCEVIVPALFHFEVTNSLLVNERRKLITEAEAIEFFSLISDLPLTTDSATPASLRNLIHLLGREYDLTAYDACYLELSLRTNSTLATFDVKLASAMRKAGGVVFKD